MSHPRRLEAMMNSNKAFDAITQTTDVSHSGESDDLCLLMSRGAWKFPLNFPNVDRVHSFETQISLGDVKPLDPSARTVCKVERRVISTAI